MKIKHIIHHNVRFYLIVFVFLLVLSGTALYILFYPVISPPTGIITRIPTPPALSPTPVQPGVLELEEGKVVSFANDAATIKLIESSVGLPYCADCMETAIAEVSQENRTERIEFRFGGIAGFHEDTAEAFMYEFKVTELRDGFVRIEYKDTRDR